MAGVSGWVKTIVMAVTVETVTLLPPATRAWPAMVHSDCDSDSGWDWDWDCDSDSRDCMS